MANSRSSGPTREDLILARNAIAKGIITQSQLEECVRIQKKSSPPKPLGAVMLEQGILNDDDLLALLAEHPEFVAAAKVEQSPSGEESSGQVAEPPDEEVGEEEVFEDEAAEDAEQEVGRELVEEPVEEGVGTGAVQVTEEAASEPQAVGEGFAGEPVSERAAVGAEGAPVEAGKKESRFGAMSRAKRQKPEQPMGKLVSAHARERPPRSTRKPLMVTVAAIFLCAAVALVYLVLTSLAGNGDGEQAGAGGGESREADRGGEISRKELGKALEQALALKGEERLRALNDIIGKAPDFGAAYYHRGILRALGDDREGAIDDFTSALEKGWERLTIRLRRGSLLLDAGRIGDAELDFRKAVGLDEKSAEAHYGLARCFAETSRWKLAVDEYTRAIGIKEDFGDAWFARGMALMELRDYDGAIGDFNQSADLKCNVAAAHAQRGLAFHMKGDFETAALAYTEAIGKKPGDAVMYNNRGTAYHEAGRYDDAIRDFTKALGIDRGFGDALLNRGNASLAKGDYGKARSDFQELLDLGLELAAFAHRGMARAYAMEGNAEDAIRHIRMAIENGMERDALRDDQFFDGLRQHEGFKELVE